MIVHSLQRHLLSLMKDEVSTRARFGVKNLCKSLCKRWTHPVAHALVRAAFTLV
jgi:hypothetical protein